MKLCCNPVFVFPRVGNIAASCHDVDVIIEKLDSRFGIWNPDAMVLFVQHLDLVRASGFAIVVPIVIISPQSFFLLLQPLLAKEIRTNSEQKIFFLL